MKRIQFLKAASAGLAALPFTSFADVLSEDELYDVVIVGAGLSGLTAAKRLAEANKNILVLEAQDRVGGRTWSQPVGENDFIDIGGQWIGKGHEKMYRLVEEAGLKTFPTYTSGKNILRTNGINRFYRGENPPIGLRALLAAQKGINRFDKAAASLSIDTPWLTRNVRRLDELSLGDWIDQTISNTIARNLVKRTAEGELCQSVYEISLLQALASARATGSLKQAEKIEGGALQDRIYGGAQGVSHYLYRKVKPRVRLNYPVSSVQQFQDHLLVSNNHFSVKTKKLILAVPLAAIRKILFTPSLSHEKQQLINSMTMGTVVKTHAVYARPFWRLRGLSGASLCLDEVVELTLDNSVHGSQRGILASLIHADRAKTLLDLSSSERKEKILTMYVNLFGSEASQPMIFHDYSFTNNPWIGGAYSGYYQKGLFSTYGEHIARPEGNIHWAGTETSTKFRGFMEGAVLSGERVADEILSSLSH